jgi:hypothetical protein
MADNFVVAYKYVKDVDFITPLLKRLFINLMKKNELTQVSFDNPINLENVDVVPAEAKIVITSDPNSKTIYHDQYYFQNSEIDKLDIDVLKTTSLSISSPKTNANLVLSKECISNLKYYVNKDTTTYTLYMYDIEWFIFDNVNETLKNYTDIHLLDSSYEVIKYFFDTNNIDKQNIHIYVYDQKDLVNLNKIFVDDDIIIDGSITIYLYIGWIEEKEEKEELFSKYMNLILNMTKYKMKMPEYKFNINKNKLNISENNPYFDCVQVLLDEYIMQKKPKPKNYRACLAAIENLKTLNDTIKIKKEIDNGTIKMDSMMNIEEGMKRIDNINKTLNKTLNQLETKFKKLESDNGKYFFVFILLFLLCTFLFLRIKTNKKTS